MKMRYQIAVGENKYDVEIGAIRDGIALVTVNMMPYEVTIENYEEVLSGGVVAVQQGMTPSSARLPVPPRAAASPTTPAQPPAAGLGVIVAPIPGLIMEIIVSVGDHVTAGQVVAIMEAMKMLNNITCQVSGTVREIRAQKGSEVSTGDVLLVIG
jgi:glutaconyl-CoA/methylmalonyl-CoA decarboxylase subunit gamma